MTLEEIIQKVNSLCAEEFEIDINDITPDANVKDTLLLDSLNLVDLVALTQAEFQVTIPVDDLRRIVTFSDLYEYISLHSV